MNKIKKTLIILSTGGLIILFTNPFLELYAKIIGRGVYAGFMGLSGKNYSAGFIISYAFFVTLALMIFGGKKKYHLWAWLLIPPILLIQLSGSESAIISVIAALIAWMIAHIILFIKSKLSKS